MHVSELLAVIDDTIFDKDTDKEIAIHRFAYSKSEEKCAEITGFHVKTIIRRCAKIEECLKCSINRPYQLQKLQ